MAANGQSVPATAAADGSAAPSQPMSPASHATRKFLSGSASGVMSALILQPFDVVKTKQQGFSSDLRRGGRGLGAFQTVRGVIASDGVTGLWRGLTPSLVRVFFGVGIYFSAYEKLVSLGLPKQQDGSSYVVSATDSARTQQQERGSDTAGRGSRAASGAQNGSMDASRLFLAGAMARVTAATMVLPVTVIKTRLEWGAGANLLPAAAAGAAPGSASRVVYRGGWHALTHIATHEGLRGLYAGLGATIIRDAPFAGIHVVTYTRLKHLLASTRARDTIPQPVQNLVTSASAAVFATLITHPADVVRTRAQMMPKGSGAPVTFSRILAEEGVRSFFRGFVPRIAKRASSTTLAWVLYEEIVRLALRQ